MLAGWAVLGAVMLVAGRRFDRQRADAVA
jgi:hypothetical protein